MSQGIRKSVDIPLSLTLLLHTIALNIRSRETQNFDFNERDLYYPLKVELERLLPFGSAVDQEATLTKLGRRQTDISIRCIGDAGSENPPDFMPWCFIEIKKEFGEGRLTIKQVSDDLQKLRDCRTHYLANTYFVLICVDTQTDRLETFPYFYRLGHSKKVSYVSLESSDKVWLMPAGRKKEGGLQVHVWAVSDQNDFSKGYKEYCFSVFQDGR